MEICDIYCVNDGRMHKAVLGTPLSEIAQEHGIVIRDAKTGAEGPVLAALVDHKLKELRYRLVVSHEVEFIGMDHPDGRRCYIRSLCFVLQKAVRELFPDKILVVHHSLPSGLYCELLEQQAGEDGSHPVWFITDDNLDALRGRMREIVEADLPFGRKKMLSEDVQAVFRGQNQPDKAELIESLGRYITSLYTLGDAQDTFYGPLVPSTGFLKVFDISGFADGFCLQTPMPGDPARVLPMKRQSKIATALKNHADWCRIIGINGVGTLNKQIQEGHAVEIINVAEARHERKYAEIANQIYERRSQVRIVFIAGPSSSGKTSSSLRLALQCKVLGLNPKVIELDNYFHNREDTPKDENGDYDFESLYAMDLDLLNRQLNDLLEGREIEIPTFDFKQGQRVYNGRRMKLEDRDILIMEGIHALNPAMTQAVDNARIFRVYASALTSLGLDENNSMSTSDNRLLRRIVRDNRVRGITPEQTILRWNSVRRGETRNIFPFQENADAVFNSALIFELPMLKYYAEPLLRRISPNSPAYTEAVRLLKFLDFVVALQPSEIAAIPPTSIMREFIGGQTL
ncbi:MAG: nucleoside kinase [Bacteroidales bacterium]|nr:nucleoside kinase [Bacteroidales bacterium]